MRNLRCHQFTDGGPVERFMTRWVTTEKKGLCQQGIEKHVQQSDKCLSSGGDS
jgi:hypothetical protein